MTIVVDASAVVAALVDGGPDGQWAEAQLRLGPLVAPNLLPVEVASVLRWVEASGAIGSDTASMALVTLGLPSVRYAPFGPLAGLVWDLRRDLTAYDAFYVALAETVGAPFSLWTVAWYPLPAPPADSCCQTSADTRFRSASRPLRPPAVVGFVGSQ